MSSRKEQKSANRVVREQLAREKRRTQVLWTTVAAVSVLLLAGLIGWSVWSSQRTGDYTAPPGANKAATGIALGDGPVTVDIYEDFICPGCGQFEQLSGAALDKLVEEGKATVVYHPVAFLDRFSTTDYSTRSSAASGCAAKGGKFREYAKGLFEKQPPEGGAGLSNDELADIAANVGLDKDEFSSCLKDGTYKSWTAHVTEEASKAGVDRTPTVLVNGKPLEDTRPEGITAAVDAAKK